MKLHRGNVWRVGILFAFIAIAGSTAVVRPVVLADNKFMHSLMGPDLVSVLVVVLTVTFASIANVHLSISRLVAKAQDQATATRVALLARDELNSNAWSLFWAFLVALIALFVNGEFPADKLIDALTTAVCLTVVLFNGLVMHDLYRSIFLLASNAGEEEGSLSGSPQK